MYRKTLPTEVSGSRLYAHTYVRPSLFLSFSALSLKIVFVSGLWPLDYYSISIGCARDALLTVTVSCSNARGVLLMETCSRRRGLAQEGKYEMFDVPDRCSLIHTREERRRKGERERESFVANTSIAVDTFNGPRSMRHTCRSHNRVDMYGRIILSMAIAISPSVRGTMRKGRNGFAIYINK